MTNGDPMSLIPRHKSLSSKIIPQIINKDIEKTKVVCISPPIIEKYLKIMQHVPNNLERCERTDMKTLCHTF